MNIADLLSHAATEIERKRIELAYMMGKVDGKNEVLDILKLKGFIGDDKDE